MALPADSSETQIGDFARLIQFKVGGESPLIVGGHAVNLWALAYRTRLGPAIGAFLPFTSKDLDLFGSRGLLDELHREFGGEKRLAEARGPVIGLLETVLDGRLRRIEVLHTVRGLRPADLSDVVPLEVGPLIVRVLSPLQLLKAKIANAAGLDQRGRNDVKHLRMILLCLREFIADFAAGVSTGKITPRTLVNLLEETRSTISSAEASRAALLWKVVLPDVWPIDRLSALRDDKVNRFLARRLRN